MRRLIITISIIISASITHAIENIQIRAGDSTQDAEYNPTKEDTQCWQDTDCIIISKGCCLYEKILSVNKDRSSAIIDKIKAGCRPVEDNFFAKEKNHLCLGREKMLKTIGFCKKDTERPGICQ